jgi:MerR family mercuric resistance operon transcriptional regulator
MEPMTIGQFAAAGGVNVETVRYYQRRGLLEVPAREPGRIARYAPAALARLRFVRRAQSLGFSLEDVQELLSLEDGQACASAHRIGEAKLAQVRERIRALHALEHALGELVDACARTSRRQRCPMIERLMTPP